MTHVYDCVYTDLFAGEPNYGWVRRCTATMPELTHYGYDGSTNYAQANKMYERELMRQVKQRLGLTGVRGEKTRYGDTIEFRPRSGQTVLFITLRTDAQETKK